MKYNFSGFTQKANEALNLAIETAEKMGHTYIGSEHILMGISSVSECSAARILLNFGITTDKLADQIKQNIGYGIKTSLNPDLFTPRVKHIIELSVSFARDSGKLYVGTEHILIAILNDCENYAQKFISNLNCNCSDLLNVSLYDSASQNDKSAKKDNKKSTKSQSQSIIEKHSRDLTKLASSGKLSKVIGRDEEIQRVMQILSRKSKNNPCLVGDSGVGKTAIVEGIAQMIANNTAPEGLSQKRIIEVSLTSMVAGTKYRGDFEERIKSIIDEATLSNDIILFIDEIHTIVGAGSAEGSTDAANMLKPYLARGDLQIIGATTINEYRKTIEKDAALDRRFLQVMVNEPSESQTIEILIGLKDSYESFHNVKINNSAILSAVRLSSRYITDKFLPDKAIDLIDEAAAAKRIKELILPENVKKLYTKLDDAIDKKIVSIKTQDYESAAKYRDIEDNLRKEIKESGMHNKVELEITDEDIANLVSKITKIPVNKLTEDDAQRLLRLETDLKKSVIGQDNAIKTISEAIIRSRTGLKDPKRPIGCYLFLGPTGVGKTELCKVLSRNLFGNENAMIRIDMSEFSERHSISKLIGAPPGYVGYDNGGGLTEKIRSQPYSLVLFDEIEKAHADIYNVLLQIMDDGLLTDSQGRQVSFKNAVIILTSNIGGEAVFGNTKMIGFADSELSDDIVTRNVIEKTLKDTFKPEFLNRMDEYIVFKKLCYTDIKAICRKMLDELSARLMDKKIKLSFTNNAIEQIVRDGYNEKYGARPLRRVIESKIGNIISQAILTNQISENIDIEIDYVNQFLIKIK